MSKLEQTLIEARRRFEERLQTDRAILETAAANGDMAAARQVAHQLAGTAAMYGHNKIGEAADDLERVIIRAKCFGIEVFDAIGRLCAALELTHGKEFP